MTRRYEYDPKAPLPSEGAPYEIPSGHCCGCGADNVKLTKVSPVLFRYRCDVCLAAELKGKRG